MSKRLKSCKLLLNNKKIFIECSPGVGDLVVLSPILRALKERYPSCILTIMSKRNSLRVIERLPYVDHICPVDEGTKIILKKMWKQDYVIFINYKPLLFALAKLLGVPHRIGPCKEKNKKWGVCTKYFQYDEDVPNDIRETDYFMSHICEALEIPALDYIEQTSVSMPSTEEIEGALSKLKRNGHISGKEYICISPFANTELDIPMSTIESVVSWLLQKYDYEIVFLGAESSSSLTKLIKSIDSLRLIDMTNKTGMMDLISILKKAKMLLCADSGPMHISAALGTLTVPIFSSGNIYRWAPRMNCYPITLNLSCSPCKAGRHICKNHKCILGLSPNIIVENIDKILRKREET